MPHVNVHVWLCSTGEGLRWAGVAPDFGSHQSRAFVCAGQPCLSPHLSAWEFWEYPPRDVLFPVSLAGQPRPGDFFPTGFSSPGCATTLHTLIERLWSRVQLADFYFLHE